MEKYPDVIVGWLYQGQFYCEECAGKLRPGESVRNNKEFTPVYRINIGIYSQKCHWCKKLVVEGVKKRDGEPLSLFEG